MQAASVDLMTVEIAAEGSCRQGDGVQVTIRRERKPWVACGHVSSPGAEGKRKRYLLPRTAAIKRHSCNNVLNWSQGPCGHDVVGLRGSPSRTVRKYR